jgi:hypothetical protein
MCNWPKCEIVQLMQKPNSPSSNWPTSTCSRAKAKLQLCIHRYGQNSGVGFLVDSSWTLSTEFSQESPIVADPKNWDERIGETISRVIHGPPAGSSNAIPVTFSSSGESGSLLSQSAKGFERISACWWKGLSGLVQNGWNSALDGLDRIGLSSGRRKRSFGSGSGRGSSGSGGFVRTGSGCKRQFIYVLNGGGSRTAWSSCEQCSSRTIPSPIDLVSGKSFGAGG